jgi:glycogen debranching enzyme
MPITFDRTICRDLDETIRREWLVTNGLGGYASGTVAGVLTRMQHGLLVASPRSAASPQLLLAKIDEEVVFDQRTYYLGTNEYRDGTFNPAGFVHLESFRLEEGFPVFTYHLGGVDGIMLEKRIWMPSGQDTTYIQYRVLRTAQAEQGYRYKEQASSSGVRVLQHGTSDLIDTERTLSLTLLPLVASRPYDQPQYGRDDQHFQVQIHPTSSSGKDRLRLLRENEAQELTTLPEGVIGCTLRGRQDSAPFGLFAAAHPNSKATFIPTGVWYWHFLRRQDQAAGCPDVDDLYLPGVIRATLWPGEESVLTVIASAEDIHSQSFTPGQFKLSYQRSIEQQRSQLYPQRYFGEGGVTSQPLHIFPSASFPRAEEAEAYLRQIVQAADRFIVRRAAHRERNSRPLSFYENAGMPTIVTDYFSLGNATRDALIALPGLLLPTRRFDEAQLILRNTARYFRQGLLPDCLPLPGQEAKTSDYRNVDTTLWFFYALDHYLRAARDYELLDELYQRLVNALEWYTRGTFNGIQADANDGLLSAQQPGQALTWMSAVVDGQPVTPRAGKPVEVNALWYNALMLMHAWSRRLNLTGHITHLPTLYRELAEQCKTNFNRRFWNSETASLYDVVDGPGGSDAAFRPNQLLAFSLRYPILAGERRLNVLEQVEQRLLTPYGLRTLAPDEAGYQGRLGANEREQLQALHQGSAWPWLLGPYVDALFAIQEQNEISARAAGERRKMPWKKGAVIIEECAQLFEEDMLTMLAGAYDGDAPAATSYQVASARSIGEILRVYTLLASQENLSSADVETFEDEQHISKRQSYISIRK